jgi:PEGA domain/Tetratricopeptide repeat
VTRIVVLALTLCVFITQGTSAQELGARELFQRGQGAYAQGDYEAAIRDWSRAYELDPRPLLQFNLSQALERLGRLEQAVAALELYLANATPDDPSQADARARQATIRERIGRTAIRIVGGQEGATIRIDGTDRGRTPHPDPLAVTPGAHEVVVELTGYTGYRSNVVAAAGNVVDLQVQLVRDEAGTQVAEHALPIGPIVLLSTGGAAMIVGGVLGGLALSSAQSAPSSSSPEADSARGMALGSDIALWGGLAVAAGGAIWLALDLTSTSPGTASLTVRPWASAQDAGLRASGQF